MAERLVVIGNGMAAGRTLEELFELAPDRYDVTIFGAEPRVNYNRIMLSPVLSGEAAYEDILIHDEGWYAEHKVTLHRSRRIVEIDRDTCEVVDHEGARTAYDRLIIATGSVPVIIPVPGSDLQGVLAYRDLDDVEAMKAAARGGGRAVVIGGGLLGLEAAAGLAMQGMKVTVIHLKSMLLDRQLDLTAATLLQTAIESRDIDVICGANTKAIRGTDHVEGVELDDGRNIPCSLVVMAVGIRPNIAMAKGAGLEVERGIKVDDGLVTNDPRIFAVGECVEHRGEIYGLVAPLYEMGKVLAARLAGDDAAVYAGSVVATKLKVTGINLYSAGDFTEKDGRHDLVLQDEDAGTYRRLVIENDRLVGAVLYGDTADGPWFFELVRANAEIGVHRDTLIFGEAFAPEPEKGLDKPQPSERGRPVRPALESQREKALEAA